MSEICNNEIREIRRNLFTHWSDNTGPRPVKQAAQLDTDIVAKLGPVFS